MQLIGYVEFFTTTWCTFYCGIYTALYIDHFLAKFSKKKTNKQKRTGKLCRDELQSFKSLDYRIKKNFIKSTSRYSPQWADVVSERSQCKRSIGNQVHFLQWARVESIRFSSTTKVQNSMLVSLSPLRGCWIGKLVHTCAACVQQLLLRPQEFCTHWSLKTEK